ncbi:unnamed protein product [marine sediment metagenome]|uniref:Uncharacterized protein n=1 Tax=marine sediment metagenome TaxID=412755 RepID=X1BPH3_9ZZZZ
MKSMNGKDILKKEYAEDELRMKTHLQYVQSQIDIGKKAVSKMNVKVDKLKKELKELEEMTLTKWVKNHSKN